MPKATSKEWKFIEMPEEFETFILDKEISMDEYGKILIGLIPEAMEDKWFIYVEGSKIYFHRSWTGNCIYITTIEEFDGNIALTKTEVNRNRSQYKGTDLNEDKTVLNYIIDRLLLSKNISFPSKDTSIPEDRNVIKHTIVGYGRSNSED